MPTGVSTNTAYWSPTNCRSRRLRNEQRAAFSKASSPPPGLDTLTRIRCLSRIPSSPFPQGNLLCILVIAKKQPRFDRLQKNSEIFKLFLEKRSIIQTSQGDKRPIPRQADIIPAGYRRRCSDIFPLYPFLFSRSTVSASGTVLYLCNKKSAGKSGAHKTQTIYLEKNLFRI